MTGPNDPRLSHDGVGGSLLLPLPLASGELTRFEVQVPEQAVNDLQSRMWLATPTRTSPANPH
jgi:hypothetical protein